MYESLEEVLGDRWCMFYHAAWPIDRLTSVADLAQCLKRANENLGCLGRDLSQWPPGDQDQIARLVWVNWIYTRLTCEPIRKPILAHAQAHDLVVDCGDTRLMALRLHDPTCTTSVIVTDSIDHAHLYQSWTRVSNQTALLDAAGFAPDAFVGWTSGGDKQALVWLELGDSSTAHHLHDQDQRVLMMQRYLESQSRAFEFTERWARTVIDWRQYQD